MAEQIVGVEALKKWLDEFPEAIQRRVCRLAVKKAGVAVLGRAEALTPRQRKFSVIKNAKTGQITIRNWHTKDKYIAKAWNRKDIAMQILGVQSGFGRLAHLLEDGSADRWHNMRTSLRTRITGTGLRNRRVQRPGGGFKTIKEQFNRTKRFGTGSKPLPGGKGRYVGRMPAFHPLAKAMAQTSGIAQQIIETEIRAGLSRVIARNGGSAA